LICLLGCAAPTTQLNYQVEDNCKIVKFNDTKNWRPEWSEQLIAQLEKGTLTAYDSSNEPVPADSLKARRRLRGLVIVDAGGPNVGEASAAQVVESSMLHQPKEVVGTLVEGGKDKMVELSFYDSGNGLYNSYARVRQSDLEKLTGTQLEFVPKSK
jgi:hypothetical protein